jgi:hypothetical protein
MTIDTVRFAKPFQAEYEGSIPFTRSRLFISMILARYQ